MVLNPEYFESLPLYDHAELMTELPVAERLFHIVDLANYRYDHSPELTDANHSQSRGTVLNAVRNALIGKGYSYSDVQEAVNKVVHRS